MAKSLRLMGHCIADSHHLTGTRLHLLWARFAARSTCARPLNPEWVRLLGRRVVQNFLMPNESQMFL